MSKGIIFFIGPFSVEDDKQFPLYCVLEIIAHTTAIAHVPEDKLKEISNSSSEDTKSFIAPNTF